VKASISPISSFLLRGVLSSFRHWRRSCDMLRLPVVLPFSSKFVARIWVIWWWWVLVKSWDEVGDEERGRVIEERGEWMEEGGWKRKGEEERREEQGKI